MSARPEQIEPEVGHPAGKELGPRLRRFRFPVDGDVAADIREKYGYDGAMLAAYAGHSGATIHKWHHYIPLYDRYFARFRHAPVRFLEIGVGQGGSLSMWRRYFGDSAAIFGIDVRPECVQFDGQGGHVRIGSQEDTTFLDEVLDEMGGVDVVLDDGSHRMDHIRASLKHLFPRVSAGGVYMIEDLHTAYGPNFGGGHAAPANFFNMVRDLFDDMHRWYHDEDTRHPGVGDACSGIHVHDSMVVLEKDSVHPPVHSTVGAK